MMTQSTMKNTVQDFTKKVNNIIIFFVFIVRKLEVCFFFFFFLNSMLIHIFYEQTLLKLNAVTLQPSAVQRLWGPRVTAAACKHVTKFFFSFLFSFFNLFF
uniref:Uncharacterized protein n=1 Tax=Anguilla anguilla TaxID=7936 RepID=A0A0E9WL07_ANGAN